MALRQFLHRCELRVAVLTAVALLFAQLGAMSHAYSHDAASNSASAHHSGARSPGANSHDLCNDCLAYAPLLAAASAPGALPIIPPQGRGVGVGDATISLVDLSLTLAFRSRAPPYPL